MHFYGQFFVSMVQLSLISEFILVKCIFLINFLVQWMIFLVEGVVQSHFLHPLFVYALDMFGDDNIISFTIF